jgi:tRNA A-37 threonylcarbamoyl transferase component Bud32
MMNWGKQIGKGNTADIYLREGRIIKVLHERFPAGEAAIEATKQRLARDGGLHVPQIFEVGEENGRQIIVMEHCPGRSMGDILFDDLTQAERLLKWSVELQRQIHAICAPGIEKMKPKLAGRLHAEKRLTDRQRDKLLQQLQAMSYEERLCHGDFHVNNIIVGEGEPFLIDWVDATAGDIRADACRSYLLYSHRSQELAQLYLRLYCESSGFSEEEILGWLPILAAARLAEGIPNGELAWLLELVHSA